MPTGRPKRKDLLFPDKLQCQRIEAKYKSKAAFARATGIHEETIGHYERGERCPSEDMVLFMAQELRLNGKPAYIEFLAAYEHDRPLWDEAKAAAKQLAAQSVETVATEPPPPQAARGADGRWRLIVFAEELDDEDGEAAAEDDEITIIIPPPPRPPSRPIALLPQRLSPGDETEASIATEMPEAEMLNTSGGLPTQAVQKPDQIKERDGDGCGQPDPAPATPAPSPDPVPAPVANPASRPAPTPSPAQPPQPPHSRSLVRRRWPEMATVIFILLIAVLALSLRLPSPRTTHSALVATLTRAVTATPISKATTAPTATFTPVPTATPSTVPTATPPQNPYYGSATNAHNPGYNPSGSVTLTFVGPSQCDWDIVFQMQGFPAYANLSVFASATGHDCNTGAATHRDDSALGLCTVNASGTCRLATSYYDGCCAITSSSWTIVGSHQYFITDGNGNQIVVTANN